MFNSHESPDAIACFTFLGTSEHRSKHQSALWQAHQDIENYAKSDKAGVKIYSRLFDGPGSLGTETDPQPGTYYYDPKIDSKILKANGLPTYYDQALQITESPLKRAASQSYKELLDTAYAVATGEGCEDILLEAAVYLEKIREQNGDVYPKTLNLQGFSRGADNCVRFANIVNRMHPEIKINLFLVDPVPGPGRRKDPDSYHIPANVDQCRVILMLNEHRVGLNPQHLGRYTFANTATRLGLNYCAGQHGSGLMSSEGDERFPKATQEFVQDSLLKFNIDNGALGKDAQIKHHHTVDENNVERANAMDAKEYRSSLDEDQRFALLCQGMDSFKLLSSRQITSVYSRSILKNRRALVLDQDLFIDQEHRELFKNCFPKAFNWFFEANIEKLQASVVIKELSGLKNKKYGNFYSALCAKFNISDNKFPTPSGRNQKEKPQFGQALVSDELSYLRYCLSEIVNSYKYGSGDTYLNRNLPGFIKKVNPYSQYSLYDSIKKQLRESYKFNDTDALNQLKGYISKQKDNIGSQLLKNPKLDSIEQKILKICSDSAYYIERARDFSQTFKKDIPEKYNASINSELISDQSPFHQRLALQNIFANLYSETPSSPQNKIFLNQLQPFVQQHFGEERLTSRIYKKLASYVYWREWYNTICNMFYISNNFIDEPLENLKSKLDTLKDLQGKIVPLQELRTILKEIETTYSAQNLAQNQQNPSEQWNLSSKMNKDYLMQILKKLLIDITIPTPIHPLPVEKSPGYPPREGTEEPENRSPHP